MAACASILLLAGCGQKGPLFMPKVPPDPLAQTSPKPAMSKPGAADADAESKPAPASK
nr:lipoprotein [Herbaspirillum sp. LeCh32-8]